jgi:hypothetical protein
MKKTAVWTLVLAVGLLAFAACNKGGGPGASKSQDMLAFMPQNVSGVMFIDVNRAMNTEFVTKTLADPKNAEGLQEFIKKSGLDPQKDIAYVAFGMTGSLSGTPSGFGIINLKYDKAALLAKMKENEAKFIEGEYEGIATIQPIEEPKVEEAKPAEGTDVEPKGEKAEKTEEAVKAPETPEKPMLGAFLDASNIAVGPVDQVKAVIDVMKKKGASAKDNVELAALLKDVNKSAIAWGVVAFNPEDVKKMVESTPMLSSLSSLKAITMHFDYANKTLDMAIRAVTADAGKNKEIADMLNGFKSMGALAAGEKPEIGELLNKIEITSGTDNVTIKALLPEELLTKLSKTVESELKNKLGAEVKPEEKPAEPVKK